MSKAVDQVTGRRSAGDQLAEGIKFATAAMAEFVSGEVAPAFRLLTRARTALAAAQGEMARTARAELAIGEANAHKPAREQAGCPGSYDHS